MRHTLRRHCKSIDKAHLWRLPEIQVPVDMSMSPSKRGLLVFTLFKSHHRDDTVRHHDGLSACWARKSWLENTDAADFGIEAKFYVEEAVRDQAEIVFSQNHISEDDVLYFDGEPFEGDPLTRCGKKCSLFSDKQFADYDWVFQVDTDLFAMRGRYPFPFFDRFFGHCTDPVIGSLFIGYHETGPPYPNISGKSWVRWMHGSDWDAELDNKNHVTEWVNRVKSLGGEGVVKNFLDSDTMFPEPQGALQSFPAKFFHENAYDDCRWLERTGKLLQTDEATLCLWYLLGNRSYSIRDELDIPVISSDLNLGADELEAYKCFVRREIPFLFHFSTTLFESVWRRRIDAI